MAKIDKTPFKTDKNGTKYYYDWTCPRCGGAGGADAWKATGWKCYDCGGSGRSEHPSIYKEYTPEYRAILDQRAAKRQAKRTAELEAKADEIRAKWLESHQFNADGDTFVFLGNTYEQREQLKALGAQYNNTLGWHISAPVDGFNFLKLNVDEIATPALAWGYTITASVADIEERKAAAMPAKVNASEHVGAVGDRIAIRATLTHRASWENNFISWKPTSTYLHTFEDKDGNVYVWKTSNGLPRVEIGDVVTVRGTVKGHGEYKDVKQTELQRCRVEK